MAAVATASVRRQEIGEGADLTTDPARAHFIELTLAVNPNSLDIGRAQGLLQSIRFSGSAANVTRANLAFWCGTLESNDPAVVLVGVQDMAKRYKSEGDAFANNDVRPTVETSLAHCFERLGVRERRSDLRDEDRQAISEVVQAVGGLLRELNLVSYFRSDARIANSLARR